MVLPTSFCGWLYTNSNTFSKQTRSSEIQINEEKVRAYLQHADNLIPGDSFALVLVVQFERQPQPVFHRSAAQDFAEKLELGERYLAVLVAVGDREEIVAFLVGHCAHRHQFVV